MFVKEFDDGRKYGCCCRCGSAFRLQELIDESNKSYGGEGEFFEDGKVEGKLC
jgi:hypothetical protein